MVFLETPALSKVVSWQAGRKQIKSSRVFDLVIFRNFDFSEKRTFELMNF